MKITREDIERLGMIVPDVRFREEIDRFVEMDRAAPPAPGGILFLGDSDIRFWNHGGRFAVDFAGLPVLNRGFGGARTWETLLYFPETVLPGRPRLIVYCCGDNDIAILKEKGVESAVTGFRLFLDLVRRDVSTVRKVLYMGIHPSPSDEPLWGFIGQANVQLRLLCESSGGLAEFVDYNHLLLDGAGRPRPELFLSDRLHFAPELYRRLATFLRPRLQQG